MNTTKHAIIWLVLAASVAGCGTPGLVTDGEATLRNDPNSALFLNRVSSYETITENDALRGVLMLLDGKDEAESFQQRVDNLLERQILDSSWDFDATRAMTRGRFAYMIYQATEMPGGILLTVTGPNQRYCLRELQYRGMMGEGWVLGQITGLELVSVLGRADRYIQTGKVPNAAGAIDEY